MLIRIYNMKQIFNKLPISLFTKLEIGITLGKLFINVVGLSEKVA